MPANWTKPKLAGLAIREFNSLVKRDADESGEIRISFSGDFDDGISLLRRAVSLNPAIPTRGMSGGILFKAVSDAAKMGEITEASLLKSIRAAERNYLRKPSKPFRLLTLIHLGRQIQLPRVKFLGHEFRTTKAMPAKAVFDQDALSWQERWYENRSQPGNVPFWSVTVESRDSYAAGLEAMASLETLLGVWNLTLTGGVWSQRTMGYVAPQPIATLVAGPLYWVFDRRGGANHGASWHDPDYVAAPRPFDNVEKWGIAERNRKQIVGALSRLRAPYRRKLLDSLRMYYNAVAQRDRGAAFLKLWSVLERLTEADRAKDVDMIARAASRWIEKDHAIGILSVLRDVRNGQVHHAQSLDDPEAYVFQLQRYVRKLMLFHIFQGRDFAYFGEACAYLDLSLERSVLKRQIAVRKKLVRELDQAALKAE